jgi:hypothetical protein
MEFRIWSLGHVSWLVEYFARLLVTRHTRNGTLLTIVCLFVHRRIFYISKYYEFLDTWVLVMKGKAPSFLQIYHHVGCIFCSRLLERRHTT